jgi:hypothetical protein
MEKVRKNARRPAVLAGDKRGFGGSLEHAELDDMRNHRDGALGAMMAPWPVCRIAR